MKEARLQLDIFPLLGQTEESLSSLRLSQCHGPWLSVIGIRLREIRCFRNFVDYFSNEIAAHLRPSEIFRFLRQRERRGTKPTG